jgi:rhodanese-related sulfurtransferase
LENAVQAISVNALSRDLTLSSPPVVIDVRRQGVRKIDGTTVENSVWRDPALWLEWKDEVAAMPGQLVFFCAHGHEIGQGLTAALNAMGKEAKYLEGGFSEWRKAGLPVVAIASGSSTKWVTRERPKIDRIACPWLITRFIDPNAEFLYVPAKDVLRVAQETGAVPYDVPNVELSHVGDLCSFDAFMGKYSLEDPALQQLALIVRGADTSRLDLTPQSAGLYALSLGLSQQFADDQEMLRHGLVVYDALYRWCRDCQGETHNWPAGV